MTIAEVIEREGGNAAFSRRTGIPLRTVEDWKSGRRKCAAHWVRILSEWLDLPNTVSIGTLNSVLVHPRDVFRIAISDNAASIVISHNHPSGDPTPSAEDIKITKQLVSAGQIMGIKVLDHIIIGKKNYGRAGQQGFLSLRETGLVHFV